ncbi:MAG TPA: ammonium transporter [Humisphaera sp.]
MPRIALLPRWAAFLIALCVFGLSATVAAAADAPATQPSASQASAAQAPSAPAADAPAPLAGEGPVKIDKEFKIDSGSTAWLLASSALVLMMTAPGLALFYSGLVRKKNVLATMMQSFILMAVVTVLWAIIGYSLAFSEGNAFIGGLRFAFMQNVGTTPSEYASAVPHSTFMVYQCMFAIITPALICGAYAERMKFSSMLAFSVLWLLVIYCPLAHMVWGKGGLFNWGLPGKPNIPALDYAGGTVVHISSGISALVAALLMGKRVGYGRTPMPPHSVVLSVIGAGLLWVGWFGFNAGSALNASDGMASTAFVNTHFAAAAATLGWLAIEWIKTGKPTVLGGISGAVAGLVVITPAAGFVMPMHALIMGFAGGVVCFFGAAVLKHKLGYDDSLDAFGVHGIGGMLGALLTGVFASANANPALTPDPKTTYEGLLAGNAQQLVNQLIATGITIAIAAVGSFVLLKIVDVALGLRVTTNDEEEGLDITQHGEAGYNFEEEFGGTVLDDSGPAAERAGDRVAAHA